MGLFRIPKMLSTLSLPRCSLHQHRSPLQPRIVDQYVFDGCEGALQDVYPIMGPTARRICEGETMVEKIGDLQQEKLIAVLPPSPLPRE